MSKRLCQFIMITIIFFSIPICKADCSNEEIADLKKEVNKVKVEYEHIDDFETDDGEKDYNRFNVNIIIIPNNYYIMFDDGLNYKLVPTDGKITQILSNGKWTIKIYSDKCDNVIDTITFRLPKFNIYSLDPLCKNIDGEKFPLCGKYYEYEVSYDSFKERVEHYRKTYNIDNNSDNKQVQKSSFFDTILDYIKSNVIYIVGGLVCVLFILIIVLVIRKKKNRGVLS